MDDNDEDIFDDEEGIKPLPLASRRRPCHNHVSFLVKIIAASCVTSLAVSAPLLFIKITKDGGDHSWVRCKLEQIEWDVFNSSATESDNQQQCPQTTVYPSQAGCPITCRRPDGAEKSEPLYFFSIVFAFGESNQYAINGTMPPKSAYDKGINFQCPAELVHNFVKAGDEYVSRFQNATSVTKVVVNPKLHTTLSYICCLTKTEAYWARELARQWIMESYPFHFKMGFDRVECMSPRPNTWGTMLVGNEQTQCTLMMMNYELRDLLLAHDIPIITPRETQYRFHMSLALVENDGTEEESSIVGSQIQDFTHTISSKYGIQWTGLEGTMNVQHWPRVWDLRQHA